MGSISFTNAVSPKLVKFLLSFHDTASQEFHLKTSERALQHTKAVSSSSVSCSNTDKVKWLN